MIVFVCDAPGGTDQIQWRPGESLPKLPGRLYTIRADGDEAEIVMALLRSCFDRRGKLLSQVFSEIAVALSNVHPKSEKKQ